MKPPPDDDLKDLFAVLEPPPGGLTRLRARRDAVATRRSPWGFAVAGLVVAAALVLGLRPTEPASDPASEPAPGASATAPIIAAVDLFADRDPTSLHPAWIGLGQLPAPSEPLELAGGSELALAARRVPVSDRAVVFYMLDPAQGATEGDAR